MKRLLSNLISILLLCCLPLLAEAILDLELTQGTDHAIPIALIPFETKDSPRLSNDLMNIITTDLHNSGEFKILEKDQFPQKLSRLEMINFDAWQKTKIDALFMGSLRPTSNQSFEVSTQLINVYKSNALHSSNPNDSIIFKKIYQTQNAHLRRLGHTIADQIYEKLIGDRGIFSTKIAYILEKRHNARSSQYYLMIADADGYNPQPILISKQPIMSLAWAPNGKQIAYVSFEKMRASIYLSDIATGQRKLLSQLPGINGAPALSPDGQQLALVLSKTGSPKIYLLNLRSHTLKQLTEGYSIDTEPAWAPDGQSLIFTSDRGGTPQIYRFDLSTHAIERLTYDGDYNARASFTPDGNNIIFLHRANGLFNIATQNLLNGALNILYSSNNNQSPSIAPNGKMIIYAANSEEQGTLALTSLDGRIQLNFPENDGFVREPAWGPFTKVSYQVQ